MPLLENRYRVSQVCHEALPHSQRIARFHHEGFARERNQVEFLVSLSKKFHRVAPIGRTSQYQISTLEKIKHGHHPTLSSLLKRSFPSIAHDNSNRKLSFGLCRYQVALIAPPSQQLYSRDLDFHNFSSPGLTEVEDDKSDGVLATRFIIGRDFAVTRSSPESC